jgi:hypothetical protein
MALSDTQRIILSQASQRDDRLAVAPDRLPAGARQKVAAALIKQGLVSDEHASAYAAAVPIFLQKARANELITIHGDGERAPSRRAERDPTGAVAGTAATAPAAAAKAASANAAGVTGPLITRVIPASGERIPVIGMGTSGSFEVGLSPQELNPLREVLRRFVASGATVIDTAPTYSSAEDVLGAVLADAACAPVRGLVERSGGGLTYDDALGFDLALRKVFGLVSERAIRLINTGIYCVTRQFLSDALPNVTPDNAQGEFYLTDIIRIGYESGRDIGVSYGAAPREILGVNTPEDLARVEALNNDPTIHGILVQLPLPAHIDAQKVIEAISPAV